MGASVNSTQRQQRKPRLKTSVSKKELGDQPRVKKKGIRSRLTINHKYRVIAPKTACDHITSKALNDMPSICSTFRLSGTSEDVHEEQIIEGARDSCSQSIRIGTDENLQESTIFHQDKEQMILIVKDEPSDSQDISSIVRTDQCLGENIIDDTLQNHPRGPSGSSALSALTVKAEPIDDGLHFQMHNEDVSLLDIDSTENQEKSVVVDVNSQRNVTEKPVKNKTVQKRARKRSLQPSPAVPTVPDNKRVKRAKWAPKEANLSPTKTDSTANAQLPFIVAVNSLAKPYSGCNVNSVCSSPYINMNPVVLLHDVFPRSKTLSKKLKMLDLRKKLGIFSSIGPESSEVESKPVIKTYSRKTNCQQVLQAVQSATKAPQNTSTICSLAPVVASSQCITASQRIVLFDSRATITVNRESTLPSILAVNSLARKNHNFQMKPIKDISSITMSPPVVLPPLLPPLCKGVSKQVDTITVSHAANPIQPLKPVPNVKGSLLGSNKTVKQLLPRRSSRQRFPKRFQESAFITKKCASKSKRENDKVKEKAIKLQYSQLPISNEPKISSAVVPANSSTATDPLLKIQSVTSLSTKTKNSLLILKKLLPPFNANVSGLNFQNQKRLAIGESGNLTILPASQTPKTDPKLIVVASPGVFHDMLKSVQNSPGHSLRHNEGRSRKTSNTPVNTATPAKQTARKSVNAIKKTVQVPNSSAKPGDKAPKNLPVKATNKEKSFPVFKIETVNNSSSASHKPIILIGGVPSALQTSGSNPKLFNSQISNVAVSPLIQSRSVHPVQLIKKGFVQKQPQHNMPANSSSLNPGAKSKNSLSSEYTMKSYSKVSSTRENESLKLSASDKQLPCTRPEMEMMASLDYLHTFQESQMNNPNKSKEYFKLSQDIILCQENVICDLKQTITNMLSTIDDLKSEKLLSQAAAKRLQVHLV